MKSLGPKATHGTLVDIDVSSLQAIATAFGPRFDKEAGVIVDAGMAKASEVIQRAVVKAAKRHRKTGAMERGIRVIVGAGKGFGKTYRVAATGPVAHLVAGPIKAHHETVSRSEKAMPIRVGGRAVAFADVVERKASRGDPFFRRGVGNARLAVHNVLLATGRRVTAHLVEVLEGA